MNQDLNELMALLEEEFAVGEQLRSNLEAQKQAIVSWDVERLLHEIEGRDALLRSLDAIERKRVARLERMAVGHKHSSLRELLAQLPREGSAAVRLQNLQTRTRKLFFGLRLAERNLYELTVNLKALLEEALSGLKPVAVPLYGESGIASPRPPAASLIRSKV
jgi:flagellar biosynthesis/type III secretory pathway chaperone